MSKSFQVVKSNHIISASYSLSVVEQRLILACITQVRRDEPITDEVLYEVTAAEFAELCGVHPKTAYRDLKQAAEQLFERKVTILFEPNGSRRHAEKQKTRWVQTVNYVDNAGVVRLRFSKDILPFLTGLTEQFTRYEFSAVAAMNSMHAIRLFELLAQYETLGEREITIAQVQEWLQLENRYPMFADLKRRVIEPAVAQINEHSPLQVKWEQRKTGRKVTHLLFIFDRKDKKASSKAKKLSDAQMAAMARPGESWSQLKTRLKLKSAATTP